MVFDRSWEATRNTSEQMPLDRVCKGKANVRCSRKLREQKDCRSNGCRLVPVEAQKNKQGLWREQPASCCWGLERGHDLNNLSIFTQQAYQLCWHSALFQELSTPAGKTDALVNLPFIVNRLEGLSQYTKTQNGYLCASVSSQWNTYTLWPFTWFRQQISCYLLENYLSSFCTWHVIA